MRIILWVLALTLKFSCNFLSADEPIMNMMPRWSSGWGYQFHYEYRTEDDLLQGSKKLHRGFSEEVNIFHLEGVYTWKKEIRLSAKLPYVLDAEREMPNGSGGKIVQKDDGWGDLTLALPLKRYFNLDGKSGSWTFKPMLRIPLEKKDDFDIYYKELGTGLGAGYEAETSKFFYGIGAGWWIFHGDRPAELVSSIDLGYNFETKKSNGSIFWETDLHYEDDESKTFSTGPAFYFNHNDTIHSRIEWKHDLFDHQGTLDHGDGDTFKIGIGWVF